MLKEFAKDTATMAALFVCTVAVITVLLMMVYVWHYAFGRRRRG